MDWNRPDLAAEIFQQDFAKVRVRQGQCWGGGQGYEGSGWREPLQSDLQLAVDWNRPDLAAEIFQQDFAKVRVRRGQYWGGGRV